jgi:ABC-type transport system substrate-binding protein/DNA-binding SARP family transcriptional activator/sugar lactone lactonase YvrE
VLDDNQRWEMRPPIEFRVLGPLDVRIDGVVVNVGGPKQRALLALLVLSANRVVSRDRLLEEVFADESVTGPRRLNVQISRLRKVVGEQRLVTRPPGYLLQVEPGELDLHLFEQLVADGRRALEDADPARAAELLGEALRLWRGRALADLEFEPFARVEAERLEELRLAAVEDRIEAELALGRHGALVPELETLVAEHPLRERLRGQLMLALYRSGRQADALDVYRVGRSLLVDELALEPGPRLKELEQAILRQDEALELERERETHTTTALLEEPRSSPTLSEAQRVESRPSRRRLAGSAVVVVIVAVAAITVGLVTAGSAGKQTPLTTDAIALLSSRNDAITASVPLQGAPSGLAAGFGSLWVSEVDAGQVVRVDPRRHAVVQTIPVGHGPSGITTGAGDVWVVNTVDGTVSRVDPDSGTVAQTISVGNDPSGIVASAGSIWVASQTNGTVLRIDPSTGHIVRAIRTGSGSSGLAAADGSIWVANGDAGTVTRIDPRAGAVTDTIHVGDAPSAIVGSRRGVYVLDLLDATVSRIDPTTDGIRWTSPVLGAPTGLARANNVVWISDANGSVAGLDRHGRRVATKRVGEQPEAVASTTDGLWIALAEGGAGHRGGTLTIANSLGFPDTIDPADGTADETAPTQYLGLTNDGLVTFDHVAGPAGALLVPDLALALPRPSDSGRVYTFHLRPGIRYSTGAVVRPTDVLRSFERLFAIRSSGAANYLAIVGAAACSRSPHSCDLSAGIHADDRGGTVTFRLTRPDPEFLDKLTKPFADVLPGGVPRIESGKPLPATGPYEITGYRPLHEVVMTRNPRFREWSAAAQPAGYPNRIVIRTNPGGPAAVSAFAAGRLDFVFLPVALPGPRVPYLRLHHPSEVKVNPALGTNFFFLNVHAPPFNDVRVRRALNFALDRAAIVSVDGGSAAATPTCQILPPQIPGYAPYCPYTRDSGAEGRWHGPDLARARRLVAASRTQGGKVVVWDTPEPFGVTHDSAFVVAALRRLGYRATVRMMPDKTFFDYTNNSSNRAQVIVGGWGADFPNADEFLGHLTCGYWVPGDGAATSDASGFCDPRFDRQVERATALETTKPEAADALWARLDRLATNEAIWLPTDTQSSTSLVSSRVRNYRYNPVWGALVDQFWLH